LNWRYKKIGKAGNIISLTRNQVLTFASCSSCLFASDITPKKSLTFPNTASTNKVLSGKGKKDVHISNCLYRICYIQMMITSFQVTTI